MVIRRRQSKKDTQYNGQMRQGQKKTTIYKTLHRKLKIEQHDPHENPGVNSGAMEVQVVSAPHLTSVVLLLLQTR